MINKNYNKNDNKGGIKLNKGYFVIKVIKGILISLMVILVMGLVSIFLLFRNQIATLSTLKQINEKTKNYPFYTMAYKGNYGFDDYLKEGSRGIPQYEKFISKEISNGLYSKLSTNPPGCSCFTATTPNGDKLLARNLDSMHATPLLLRTNARNAYKSISMINIDNLYGNWWDMEKAKPILPFSLRTVNVLATPYLPVEGINEHGLAIATLTAVGSDPMIKKNKITINDYSMLRMVLDKAGTVKEAVKMIKKYNMDFLNEEYPTHFMIADAKGDSVVVEYVGGELHTVYSKKPYNIATNFILYDNPYGGNGLDRYLSIKDRLKKVKDILTEKQAMQLLSQNAVPDEGQWSAVYNLTKKYIYVCVGKDYKRIFKFSISNDSVRINKN